MEYDDAYIAAMDKWVEQVRKISKIKDFNKLILLADAHMNEGLLKFKELPFHHESLTVMVCLYLESCLGTKTFKKGYELMTKAESGGLNARNIRYAVLSTQICGALGNKKETLRHLESARYFGKYEAVKNLAKNPHLKSFWEDNSFKDYTRAERPLAFYSEDLKDAVSSWKNDEYDNYKDALEAARSLVHSAPSSKPELRKKAEAHLAEVTQKIKQLCKNDAAMKKYMEGLI